MLVTKKSASLTTAFNKIKNSRDKIEIRIAKRLFVQFCFFNQKYFIKKKRVKNNNMNHKIVSFIHEIHCFRRVLKQIVNVLRFIVRLFFLFYFDNKSAR